MPARRAFYRNAVRHESRAGRGAGASRAAERGRPGGGLARRPGIARRAGRGHGTGGAGAERRPGIARRAGRGHGTGGAGAERRPDSPGARAGRRRGRAGYGQSPIVAVKLIFPFAGMYVGVAAHWYTGAGVMSELTSVMEVGKVPFVRP